jgi:hypothetical protein
MSTPSFNPDLFIEVSMINMIHYSYVCSKGGLKGLIKMYVSCFEVATYIRSSYPLWICSQICDDVFQYVSYVHAELDFAQAWL